MKTDRLFQAFRASVVLLMGILVMACGEDNPDPEPESNPFSIDSPYVFPTVVSIDNSQVTIPVCDTVSKTYAVQFKDQVPDIKEGSVVLVPYGNETLIVLVTEASTNGNRVDFSGPLGDLRYVFKDVEFTIRIGDDPPSGPTKKNVFYYDDLEPGTKASKHVKLWDAPFIEDYTLWKLEPKEYPEWMIQIPDLGTQDASLGAHVEFIPDLSADIDFKFGAPTTDVLDKVAFVLAGAYDFTATFNGNIHSSIDIDFDYKMDEILDGIVHGGEGPRYFFDHTELLKHALFSIDPKAPVVIFGVPFWLHIGCDLVTEVQSMMLGEAHLTFGVESDINLSTKVTVFPYRDDSVDYEKDFKMTWDGHEPVFTGDSDLRLKWYVYPHIYVWLDRAAGPALDIKPYAQLDFEYGTNITFGEWDAYESFATLNTEGFVGLDCAVGISTPLENYFYEVDCTMKDIGNIVEGQIIKSPSGLILASEPGEIKAGKPTTFDFKVLGDFWGATATTWFPTIIKLDFPQEGKGKALFPIMGKASYTWTPQFEDDEMVARVFDVKGTVLGQLIFRAGAGDAIKVITGEASNITTESATIVSIVESSIPVLNTGIVYSSSADIPVIGGADSISQLSTVAGDSFTVTLSGLQPNTQYSYRAYAVIEGGESSEYIVYGTVKSFTTGSPSVHVTSVTLNKTQLELAVGGTETLIATVLPENASNKSVTWSSSRTSYATVSSTGVVTAVAPGTSVITATTVDGKKTASCTVTVRQTAIHVESVSLNKTQLDLTVGNTATLTATVLPENASNKSVTWSSSDTGKATVSSTGVVKGVSAGSATITVTTVDGGKTASCKVTVTAEPKLSVSTKRLDFGDQIKFTQETRGITITNSGTGTLVISSITKTNNYGDLFQLSGWTSGGSIAAGASKTINVSFQPLEERYYEETLTIVSSNSVGDKKATVTICGTGIPEPEDAQITISVDELTWGEVEVGESANKSFTVKNTGTTTLTISSIKVVATDNTVNPSYFTVSPNSSFSLAPGKSKTFSVTFAPEAVRSYSAMLSIKSNASNATQGTSTVWLSGSGIQATSKVLSASPSSLSFGYQTLGNRTHKNFTVKNTGTKAVTLYSMTATDGFIVDQTWEDGYSLGLAAGASKTFSAYFAPTQAKSYSGKITIKSNASSGDLVIPVSGIGEEAQGYLEITSGESLNFGNVNVGTSGTLYTKIRNTGEAPLNILRITCPDGFTASCTASSIKEGYNASISVSFTPTEAKSYSGSIIVYTDAENESVSIDVSGTGIKSSSGNSFVDMGLSVKWASANVGASNPEEYGHYVAWAETATKKQYLYSNYKYYVADAYFSGSGYITKYCQSPDIYGYQGYSDYLRMLTYEDDYAQAKYGGLARIPTRKEWEELKKNCTWTWTSQSGVNGYLVTSSINGNSIFLPAGGLIDYSNDEVNSVGYYWASNLEHDETYATTWELRSDKAWYSYRERYKGLTVRAVEDYTAKPMIEISGKLVFAGVKLGTTASQTVTISNTGKGTLHISEVRSTKRIGLEWTSASIAPGASKRLTVYYTPTYDPNLVVDDPETWDMTTVSITSDARNESDFILYVKGYGIGNPGNIEGTQEEPWN